MKKKRCSSCEERKSIKDDFNNDKSTRDGKKSQCRDCTRKNRPSRANMYTAPMTPEVAIVPARITSDCMKRWWV